ncbi:MAG: pilus assembly protein [Ponticaulis sp.]|nr:pilus assembly protein [Ponticaulis sp.]
MQTLMIAGLAFVAIAGLGFVFAGGNESAGASKRAKQLAATGRIDGKTADPNASRKRQTQDMLKSLREGEQKKKKSLVPQDISSRMKQAGLSASPATFWMISAILGASIGGAAFIMAPASVTESFLGEGARVIIGAFAGFAGFLGLPRWVLGFMIKRRHTKVTNQFADALDIIVRGVKSGLPLNECLRIIAVESPDPLRSEFKIITDGLSMGQSIPQALDKFYRRVPLQEVNFFNIVLGIQAQTGGNLSEALGNLSAVIRSRKMLREKIKALSSEAKASAMIIGCLPVAVMVLVYITTPAYIMELFYKPIGNLILLIGVGLMGLGIYVMRRMINFDF